MRQSLVHKLSKNNNEHGESPCHVRATYRPSLRMKTKKKGRGGFRQEAARCEAQLEKEKLKSLIPLNVILIKTNRIYLYLYVINIRRFQHSHYRSTDFALSSIPLCSFANRARQKAFEISIPAQLSFLHARKVKNILCVKAFDDHR